jgi:hypothetical protein
MSEKIPTPVDENMLFWGKFFGKVIFGHFFLSIFENPKYFMRKTCFDCIIEN